MNRIYATSLYETTVGVLGILGVLPYIWLVHLPDVWLGILLVCVTVVVDMIPIPIGKAIGSLSISLPIAVMVLFGGADAVLLGTVSVAISIALGANRTKVTTWLFNVGQMGISYIVMVTAYREMMVLTSSINGTVVFAVIVAVALQMATNHLFIHLLHVFRHIFSVEDIRDLFLADGLNIVVAIGVAFVMMMVGRVNSLFLLIIVIPTVLLGTVFRMYRRTHTMHAVQRAVSTLTQEFDLDKLAEKTAGTASQVSFADAVSVFVLNDEQTALYPLCIYPESRVVDFSLDGYKEVDGGVIWNVIRQGRWTYVQNTMNDSRVRWDSQDRSYLSMAVFPMASRGRIQGALVCYAQRSHAFSPDLIQYLDSLAVQTAVLLENAKLYQELQEQSLKDPVTGLYNYRYFYDQLRKRARESSVLHPVSVAIVDVDYFKKFNDTYGHVAGDVVLRGVGDVLQSIAGPGSVVARYGGEEFAMILHKDADSALELLEQIRVAISEMSVMFEGYRLRGISVSIGVATAPKDAVDDRDLILKADSAMYWGAKQRGRNRIACYNPEFDTQLFVDTLTGLYTLHHLSSQLREQLSVGIRDWGILCLRLVDFQSLVSAFGEDIGNHIVKHVSYVLRDSVRHGELICRYGSDEFVVLLPNVKDAELSKLAERIVDAVGNQRYGAEQGVIASVQCHVQHQSYVQVRDTTELFYGMEVLFSDIRGEQEGVTFAH